ncbi:hypothetical protein KJ359_001734 [Pestalotiopsis sp. 9143b]|nr:hypothetical protein KJ359_001734 [Pestalotiopsis sp. 9143b]
MDSLRCLSFVAPDWIRRLDDLAGQIEQRQVDLARLATSKSSKSGSSARSLRNKGSIESLKPQSNNNAYFNSDASQDTQPDQPHNGVVATSEKSKQQEQRQRRRRSSSNSGLKTRSFIQRQNEEICAIAQRRAPVVLRKRQETDFMISTVSAVPTHRSSDMPSVYYDSFVQSLFEDLVKFLSAQRNHLRRAKLNAKIAEIKRLAELELPDNDNNDEDNDTTLQPGDRPITADPTIAAKPLGNNSARDERLYYINTCIIGPTLRDPRAYYSLAKVPSAIGSPGLLNPGVSAGENGPTDVFGKLDRSLEIVQNICERAAYQVLREGDCFKEIDKIQKMLEDTRRNAVQEIDRLEKENPDALTTETPKL